MSKVAHQSRAICCSTRGRLASHSDEQRLLTYVGLDGARTFIELSVALDALPRQAELSATCVYRKTLNLTIVVMKSAQDGA
jgi:hypothetical protein